MPTIVIAPEDKSTEISRDETVLSASLRAGIPHAHACGGRARCSTCRIAVEEGLEFCEIRNDQEEALAQKLHFSSDVRLACQTKVIDSVHVRRLVLDEDDVRLTDQTAHSDKASSIGEEMVLAVMFADIRGFTPFSESLPPYDVIHILNRFFRQMGRAIAAEGGLINNYMGDGFMALFGLDGRGSQVLRAVKAGLKMLEEMKTLTPYLLNNYRKSFKIGIGIHFGEAVVGSIGSERVKRVTAIGDTVNLASRVESANKSAGTSFLVTKQALEQVADTLVVGKKFEFELPGKSGTYHLYEPIGLRE